MQSVALPQRRLLVWRDPPPLPFVWYGLLPLLALALMTLIALGPFARAIEGDVRRELREQLNAAGFGWVTIAVSGQSVTLSGEPPGAVAARGALALAREAACPTWIGRQTCAVSVVNRLDAPTEPAGTNTRSGAAAAACERALSGILAGEQIEFASGSAVIAARSGPLLDRLAREVRSCPGTIRIEGHTDITGRTAFNRALSEARAAAVRDALIARGIPGERLSARGFGASRPVADNRTEDGRERNRRIELHTQG